MSNVVFPAVARPALVTSKAIYNGCYPDAETMTFLQEETNRIAAYCVKQWSFAGGTNTAAVAQNRWRTFIHTSSHCRYAWVRVVSATAATTGSPYINVAFTVPGAGAAFATATFYQQLNTGSGADDLAVGQVRPTDGVTLVELTADTDYEVTVQDSASTTLLAISIFELALQHDTANGYLSNGVSAGTNVVDAHRSAMLPILRTAWKRNGAPLITWSCDGDNAPFTTSNVPRNLIDDATTYSTTSSPGFTIDLRHRSTVRRASSGVPVIMRAYCKTTATSGSVILYDSSGNAMGTATTTSGAAAWVSSGAFYLPETLAKYDLVGTKGGLGTTTVYAVALMQYES